MWIWKDFTHEYAEVWQGNRLGSQILKLTVGCD